MLRSRLMFLPLAAALLTGGCTTFSDADAVARVGDVELSLDELATRATDAGIPQDQELPADIVRTLIQGWIQETAVRNGVLDPATVATSEAAVASRFDAGINESGVVCPAIIITETADDADAAESDLDDGADFAEVFARDNIDPTLVAETGGIGCVDIVAVNDAAGAPEIAVLLELSGDDTYGSSALTDQLGNPVGGIVVKFRTYDELPDADRAAVDTSIRSVIAVEQVDIMVDSRYGYFDPITTRILPLG